MKQFIDNIQNHHQHNQQHAAIKPQALTPEHSHCNYKNNYYGDQLCISKAGEK